MSLPATSLRAQITGLFSEDVDDTLSEPRFDQLARAAFAFQYENNPFYARYCDRRGITPATVGGWTEIPPVPTAAFKEVPLIVGDPREADAVFRTSGTTRGAEKRGQHFIRSLDLYYAAALPMLSAYLLPDRARLPFVSLIPHRELAPDSSLSHMISAATETLAASGEYFMHPERGLDRERLERTLEHHVANGEPVCIVGTSFAFVHWLDTLVAQQRSIALPPGSRIMDTGGYKGRSRRVPPEQLRTAYVQRLGVAESHCVNEYGMTELCSQFYDRALRLEMRGQPGAPRTKRPAPWVRTRVVDPETLAPVPAGDVGILQHFDLANLYSVIAVQTEDLGRATESGFEMLGRAAGAAPRGCSIAVDLLLEANRGQLP